MNTVKKIVAVLLCGLISASMLVGCEPNQENSVNESEQLTEIGMEGVQNGTDNGNVDSDGSADYEGDFEDVPQDALGNGLIFTLNNGNTSYTVTGYEGTSSKVVIPAEHEGFPVVSIGGNAFQNCTQDFLL